MGPIKLKTSVFTMLALCFSSLAMAQNNPTPANRRVADLVLGTEVVVNLNDAELLTKGKKWEVTTPKLYQKCELVTQSHFDENLARKSGPTIYQLTQLNPSNSTWDETVRDQFTMLLSTANKDLPLLMLDCWFDAKNGQHPPAGFTLGYVTKAIGQPQLFYKPLFIPRASKLAIDFYPKFKKVKILTELQFEGRANADGSLTPMDPRLSNGKLLPRESRERTACYVTYSEIIGTSLKPYKVSARPGQVYELKALQTAYDSMFRIIFDLPSENKRLSLECSQRGGYANFEEMAAHARGILEFTN